MKAMVYINYQGKDLVITGIEAESLGGAEHRILDKYMRVDNAFAENVETITEYFMGLIVRSEIISINEFDIRYNAQTARNQKTMNEGLDDLNYLKNEIKATEQKLEELKKEYDLCKKEINEFADKAKINVCYTAPEKINEAIEKASGLKEVK